MRHRGAVAADRKTGDGAGVLLPIAPALVPGPWCGLAMVFLRDDAARAGIEAACEAEGIGLAGWRKVPVDRDALGDSALATMPRIEQLVLVRPFGLGPDEAEARAYRARRRAERVVARTSRRSRFARSPTRRSARPTSSTSSTRTCATRRSRFPSRSSTSASRRTRRPRGSARNHFGSSATTVRSTRFAATSPGCARASRGSETGCRRPSSTNRARTRRCSTTPSSSSRAAAATSVTRCRCSCRPRGRTIPSSIRRCARSTATTPA